MHWTDYLGPLMEGAWITIELTVYSTILGGLFSFLFGIGKLSGNWFIRGFSIVYIEVFRGTSLLVQLFWLYFALPIAGDMVGLDLRLPPVAAGVLALALNIGAYGAEVVRGAIEAVSRNQYEAATALNFTSRQALFRVALPQAVPEMMPSFSNLAVQNLKDTALVSLVSLADLAFKAKIAAGSTSEPFLFYIVAASFFVAMNWLTLVVAGRLERRTRRGLTPAGA